jgi:hypothetical protein
MNFTRKVQARNLLFQRMAPYARFDSELAQATNRAAHLTCLVDDRNVGVTGGYIVNLRQRDHFRLKSPITCNTEAVSSSKLKLLGSCISFLP